MREYLYLITEHEDEEAVGQIMTTEKRLTRPKKNEAAPYTVFDHDEGDYRTAGELVGMGYVDFDDDEPDPEKYREVFKEKLGEIDDEHIDKAGLNELAA